MKGWPLPTRLTGCRKDWAVSRLLKKHQEDKEYNYLVKQKCLDIGSYVLVHLQEGKVR